MKALKILFFPPVAAIVGAVITVAFAAVAFDVSVADCFDGGSEGLCFFYTMYVAGIGWAIGFGVGLVVYAAWGILWLLRERGEKRQLERDIGL
jgi:hypothetical protein